MLERTNFVRDINRNYDISIPTDLKSKFGRVGDHYRVYFDAEIGAIAYVPNNCSIEGKFLKNLSSSNNEPKRNKYILRYDCCDEVYLSLTNEQVNFFEWLKNKQVVDSDYELIPIDENIKWLEV